MNDKLFQIDYHKLIRLLLPVCLRKPIMIAWLSALTWPVQQLYNWFITQRRANLYRLRISPQVVYLEKLLNDRYDIARRRIRIADSEYHDPVYIYTRVENKPQWIKCKAEGSTFYIWQKQETSINPADFTVQISADIVFQEPEMRGLIDAYKLAGKTYYLKTIS